MEDILINDFRRIPADERQALNAVAAEVIGSARFILGEQVTAFERAWAGWCGTSHAVGVGNGMDAIEIGLRAAGFGAGDEVITTPLTAFATVLGCLRAGVTPVLADIDPESGLMDPASAERCVGPRTKAVLLVHLYGQIRAADRWKAFCSSHHLDLLEDAAQAHGAESGGRRAGAIGRWAAYSFYPTKNLGGIGDGGALCTDDAGVARRAAQLRNYGQTDRYHHAWAGLNSRLDEIQAAFLRVRLTRLSETTNRRREIAGYYHAHCRSQRVNLLAPPEESGGHVYHLFVVRTRERAAFQSHLKEYGIQSLVHYPVCAHRHLPGQHLRRDPKGLRLAERFSEECVSIPCHPYLTAGEVERVVAAVNSF